MVDLSDKLEVMRGRPKGGYSNPAKAEYRERVYAGAIKAWADRSDKTCLMLPSIEGEEIAVALSTGFKEDNIYAVERDKTIAARFEWREQYPNVKVEIGDVGRVCKRLAKRGVKIDFANFDFCGPLSNQVLNSLKRAAESGAFTAGSAGAITLLVGREAPETVELLAGMHSYTNAAVTDFGLRRVESAVRALCLFGKLRAHKVKSWTYSSTGTSRMAVARFELLDDVSTIIRKGMNERKSEGMKYCRTAPFGYRYEDSRMVAVPEEIAALDRMVEMRAQGFSLRKIAAEITALGLRPHGGARTWYAASIRDILRRQDLDAEHHHADKLRYNRRQSLTAAR